jgi:acetyl esterase/lipase
MSIKPEPPGQKPNPNVITNITEPTLTIYQPERPTGTAVIVAPGGGYRFLSIKHEGTEVCEWLNSIGVTAGLLTYRAPTNEEPVPSEKPVQDAQRAIGLIRHHATQWGLTRVGLLGFSAGGNLTGHEAFDRTDRTYPQKPVYDTDARPDFIVMIYGGGFLDPTDKTKFRAGFSVPADAPPAFFLVAHDDKSNPVEAAMLYLAYKQQNLPAELHIFTQGGHGFGMRQDGHPINEWPDRCADWLRSMGWLAK